MKSFYKFKHKRGILVAYFIMAIILLICVIVNFLHMFEVGEFVNINYYGTLISTVVQIIALVLITIMIFASGYYFGKDSLYVILGIYVRKIAYSTILSARTDEKNTIMLLYFIGKGQKLENLDSINPPVHIAVCVNGDNFDDFIKNLRSKDSKIEHQTVHFEK